MAFPPPKIMVIGNINMGLVTRTPSIPLAGENIFGRRFPMFSGGKNCN